MVLPDLLSCPVPWHDLDHYLCLSHPTPKKIALQPRHTDIACDNPDLYDKPARTTISTRRPLRLVLITIFLPTFFFFLSHPLPLFPPPQQLFPPVCTNDYVVIGRPINRSKKQQYIATSEGQHRPFSLPPTAMMTSPQPIPIRTDLVFRPASNDHNTSTINGSPRNSAIYQSRHKHTRSSYSESSPLTAVSRNNSLSFRPLKRSTPSPDKTIAVINASGRQAASLIRIATAIGYKVRAQLRNLEGVIATEVSTNPNVTVFVGELYIRKKPGDNRDVTTNAHIPGILVNHDLISQLFSGAHLAFINTTFYGNEIAIGEALADAAKKAQVQHFVYSSMPDHAAYNKNWSSVPLWAPKHKIEDYIRSIGLPATFVYTGIYNNNFTSLLYPLFCMELQKDGSFEWRAPFHPDVKLPWLDAEHDVGPAIIQLFKDGPKKWNGKRIALAYEYLTPTEVCEAFEKGLNLPVRYKRGPIEIKVKIPEGYAEQLKAVGELFDINNEDPMKQPPYFGDMALENSVPEDALALWEGPRGLEEYAGEIFPLEEEANGMTWMFDDEKAPETWDENGAQAAAPTAVPEASDEDDDASVDEGLVMRGLRRDEEAWLA